jgi:tetratricopeptide (TPR) repeat protein
MLSKLKFALLAKMRSQKILLSYVMVFSCCLMGFTWGDGFARNMEKGNKLFEAGQYYEALKAYTEAYVHSKSDNDPRLPKLYGNLGKTFHKLRNYDQAIIMYQKAFDAFDNPEFKADLADAYYNSGNAWLKQGEYQQALKAYTKAIELNPENLQARQNKELVEKLLTEHPQQQQEQKNEEKKEKQQDQQQSQNQEQQQQEKEQNQQQNEQQAQQKEQEQKTAKGQENPEDKEKRLSKEEALRILDALKEKEKLLQQNAKFPPRLVEKDW